MAQASALVEQSTPQLTELEAAVLDFPEIVECAATGGGIDYVMKAVVADVDAYQRLMDRLLDASVGIERYFGYIVTKTVKNTAPPLPFALPSGGTSENH